MKNWTKYVEAENRNDYSAPITKANDVALTLICEMKKLSKEAVINDLIKQYANQEIESMEAKDISAYCRKAKMDSDAKELGKVVLVEKVFGAQEEEENEQ